MTPKPDLRPYQNGPDSQSHSAMEVWARKNFQPDLIMTTVFDGGSQLVETYQPATKEVPYKVKGETYTQTVEIAGKWFWDKCEPMTKNQLIKAQEAVCKKVGCAFTISVCLEK